MKKRLSAIDIGTSRVCTVMADADEAGIEILGIGMVPSKGLQKGMVVNLDEARDTIRRSILMAEMSAGCKIDPAVMSIAEDMQRSVIALIKEVLPGSQEPSAQDKIGLLRPILADLKRGRTPGQLTVPRF